MSRPRVDESLEQDFIKMILTKDQGRSKGNEKWVRIRKSRCVESNRTRCCIGEFNTTLSLCGVLGVTLYFSEGFLEAAARVSLAIAGQLGREVYPQSIRLLFGSEGRRWLRGKILGRWGYQRQICLALGGHDKTGDGSFSLFLEMKLESLFLHLSCTVAFTVSFPVAVIDSYC